MVTLTNEQIEQKKQQLKQLAEEAKLLKDELVEAGAIALGSPLATEGTQELSEDDLDQAAGGGSYKPEVLIPHIVVSDEGDPPLLTKPTRRTSF